MSKSFLTDESKVLIMLNLEMKSILHNAVFPDYVNFLSKW